MPNYAIVILSEEGEEYNILLILKDGTIYEQKKKKTIVDKMIKDEVLIEEDPKTLSIDAVIAKFYLKK